jgi:murein DD-endopeptidase / murein LD-carboxypeptidase
MTGDEIANRAWEQVGTPFRVHGRTPGIALDCVGLVGVAIDASNIRSGYSLKGNHHIEIKHYLLAQGFSRARGAPRNGDIILVRCAPGQVHLMIFVHNGWVHAHAGLSQVVHTPCASPWPIIGHWRISGD